MLRLCEDACHLSLILILAHYQLFLTCMIPQSLETALLLPMLIMVSRHLQSVFLTLRHFVLNTVLSR